MPRESRVLLLVTLVPGMVIGFTRPAAASVPQDTNTIDSLKPEQARRLSEGIQDASLHLDRLRALDADTATVLADVQVTHLSLNGLTTLDVELAAAIAGFKGRWLALEGSLDVTDELEWAFCNENPLTADTVAAWVALTRSNPTGVTGPRLA